MEREREIWGMKMVCLSCLVGFGLFVGERENRDDRTPWFGTEQNH